MGDNDLMITALISRAGIIASRGWRGAAVQDLRQMKRDVALTKVETARVDKAIEDIIAVDNRRH